MSPNCAKCDEGRHHECTADPGYCECATTNHPKAPRVVDKQTGQAIPVYALLDLWMALGGEPEEFDNEYRIQGHVDFWAWLLEQARQAHYAEKASQNTASVATQPEPPVRRIAYKTLAQIDDFEEVDVEYDYEEAIRDGYGRVVHGVVRAVVTVTGRVS